MHIVPKDKFDFEACARLSHANDAEVIENLPSLLEWTADVNWPVAGPVIDRLKLLGTELIAPIQMILASQDDGWKYFLIVHLVSELREDVFNALVPDLKRIASNPTPSEVIEEVQMETIEVLRNREQKH